jgi:zinc transport system substrate-binding protein
VYRTDLLPGSPPGNRYAACASGGAPRAGCAPRTRAAFALGIGLLVATLAARAAEPLRVFVSILPQKYLVERVGGERVEVSVMVGPGQSPATFEPGQRQMSALEHAAVFFRVGMPFEAVWLPRVRAANPHMAIVDQREGLPLRNDAAGHGHDHGSGPYAGKDPHVWTSPRLVRAMAAQVGDTLARLDPGAATAYTARLQSLLADLDTLDAGIRRTLAGLEGRRFLVFHPTWGYFAQEYGLEQVAIEHEGKEPGARFLARLIDESRGQGIRAVFVQRQFSRTTAEAVARAIGARVIELDPLAEDYPANMRHVARTFREALQ